MSRKGDRHKKDIKNLVTLTKQKDLTGQVIHVNEEVRQEYC